MVHKIFIKKMNLYSYFHKIYIKITIWNSSNVWFPYRTWLKKIAITNHDFFFFFFLNLVGRNSTTQKLKRMVGANRASSIFLWDLFLYWGKRYWVFFVKSKFRTVQTSCRPINEICPSLMFILSKGPLVHNSLLRKSPPKNHLYLLN